MAKIGIFKFFVTGFFTQCNIQSNSIGLWENKIGVRTVKKCPGHELHIIKICAKWAILRKLETFKDVTTEKFSQSGLLCPKK